MNFLQTTSPVIIPSSLLISPADSSSSEIDSALLTLNQHKAKWACLPIPERLHLLETLIEDFSGVAADWVELVTGAQRTQSHEHATGIEWMQGPYSVLRNLQCLKSSLQDVQAKGTPQIPGPVRLKPNGQLSAQVFPYSFYDRLLFRSYRAEVWMEPGITPASLSQTQALAYRQPDPNGKLTALLGAGNLAAIPPTDAFDLLFVKNQVVALKLNPVNDYMAPIFAAGMRCLVEGGYLRILIGGTDQGVYLCQHPLVDEIFMTGSDKTFESIVFGPGEAGAQRKLARQPLFTRPIQSELGNVTPAIVVSGEWSQSDLDYQAENLASWAMDNAGLACNTPRVILLHAGWTQRQAFLDALRNVYAKAPLRYSCYPGSQQRYQEILAAHPEAQSIGQPGDGEIPWTLIPDVDMEKKEDICFTTESFCSVISVVPVQAEDAVEFLQRAVAFANQTLWGTLAANLVVHPKSMKETRIKTAVEQAVSDMRYGTVSINCATEVNWVFMTTPWGAFPGSTLYDIQSGNGFVHNTLMFSRPQKTVVYGKFREWPKPIVFASQGKVIRQLGPLMTGFMASPSPRKLPRILMSALG